MHIKIPRIVVGNDITGMVLAAYYNAMFIPVNYFSPFAWEYTNEVYSDTNMLFRKVFKTFPSKFKLTGRENFFKFHNEDNYYYSVSDENSRIYPKMFLWELELQYKLLFRMNNNLWNDFDISHCEHSGKNFIFKSKNNILSVDFKKAWVINPNETFFNSSTATKVNTFKSDNVHCLSHIEIDVDNHSDMNGIHYHNDFEEVQNSIINKIWYNKPFGMKEFNFGFNPKTKEATCTTQHIVCLSENLTFDQLHSEDYDDNKIRAAVFDLFSPFHRRISRSKYNFFRFVRKYIVSSNIDEYWDEDNIDFVYYSDKSEILCQKLLNYHMWQDSFLFFHKKYMNSTINLMLTNRYPKRILF